VTQRFAETRPHFSVCVVVALRPTNDPMHGFARPTIAMSGADATAGTPKSRGGNVVALWLLQIQHSFGNELLRTVNEVLARATFEAGGQVGIVLEARLAEGGGLRLPPEARLRLGVAGTGVGPA